jgi:hypothetical protein
MADVGPLVLDEGPEDADETDDPKPTDSLPGSPSPNS